MNNKVETAQEWFEKFPDLLEEPLFTLRLTLSCRYGGNDKIVEIRAFEGPVTPSTNHTRLFVELKLLREEDPLIVFPRDSFYVGIPFNKSIDGIYAKKAVLGLFSSKLEETDYTVEQLAFINAFGDEIDYLSESGEWFEDPI